MTTLIAPTEEWLERARIATLDLRRELAAIITEENIGITWNEGEYKGASEYFPVNKTRRIILGSPGKFDAKERAAIKAICYHEIAHILYTTPMTLGPDFYKAYNILEDSRIEWLITRRYPGVKKYLAWLMLKMPIGGGPPMVNSPLLMWGRRFYVREVYPGYMAVRPEESKDIAGVVHQAADLIDEYLQQTMATRRQKIIELFAKVISIVEPPITPFKDESPEHERKQKESPEEEKKREADEKAGAEEFGEKKKKESEPSTKDSLSERIRKAVEQAQVEEKKEEEQEDKKGEAEADMGAGAGGGELDPESEEEQVEFREALRKISGDTKYESYDPDFVWHTAPPLDEMTYTKLKVLLQSMKTGMGQQVKHNLKRGNVNMRRAMSWQHTGDMHVFEKRLPGRIHQSTMAVAFVLDGSGSLESTDVNGLANIAATSCSAALADTGHVTYMCWYSGGPIIGDEIAKMQGRPRKVNHPSMSITVGEVLEYHRGDINDFPETVAPFVYKFLKEANAISKFVILFTDGDIVQTELNSWYRDQELANLNVVTYFIVFSTRFSKKFGALVFRKNDLAFQLSSMEGVAPIFASILASNATGLFEAIRRERR